MGDNVNTVVGLVKSATPKSLVVAVVNKKKNMLGKYVTTTTKIHVHDEDCVAVVGDEVEVVSSRPISKQKCWLLHRVIKKQTTSGKE